MDTVLVKKINYIFIASARKVRQLQLSISQRKSVKKTWQNVSASPIEKKSL